MVRLDTPAGPVTAARPLPRRQVLLGRDSPMCPAFVDRLDAAIEVEGLGTDHARHRLWRHVLRHRRCDAARLCDRAGRGARPRRARREGPPGGARAARRSSIRRTRRSPASRSCSSTVRSPGVGKVTRNTCIVAPGRSDRSPTGTGTCARMAVLHARGLMQVGDADDPRDRSSARASRAASLGETTVAGRRRSCRRIEGRAWITGFHNYLLDPADPYPEGYVVADTWGVTGGLAMTQARDPAAG